jgi:predicted membrane-bound spermidine synthase
MSTLQESTLSSRVIATLKRDVLLYVVFFTGLVVLAVEVMAVRVLSPYFGNTVYTFTSVLSIILAALSCGYWYGGRMADKKPNQSHFFRLVFLSGMSVLIAHIFSLLLLPLLSMSFSIVIGPLVAATAFFFVPGLLFGTLSPYVIKLRSQALPERGVGTVSGEVFFWSTLGSIGGSLLSGFFLVPVVGIQISMVVLALLVCVVGGLGLLHAQKAVTTGALMVSALLVSATVIKPLLPIDGTVIYAADGVYERVSVVDTVLYGQESRLLLLDRSYSSAVALSDGKPVFPYIRLYDLHKLFVSEPTSALVLGAGTGTLAKTLLEQYPDIEVDMVDVEPTLFKLAHEYFFLPDTERLGEHVADARQYLLRTNTSYDLIYGDLFNTLLSAPWHVTTQEFYALMYDRLNDGGIYVGNYIMPLDSGEQSLFFSTLATLNQVFDEVYVFVDQSMKEGVVQNMILLCTKSTDIVLTKENLQKSGIPELRPLGAHLYPYDKDDLKAHTFFTDNTPASELYTAIMIKRYAP